MQTHEWEALLDGTTPGPWEATDERDDMGIIGPDGFTLIDVNEYWSRCTRADIDLAAAAPEAVSEVIRLRKTIAAVRDDYKRSAEADSLGHFNTVPLIPVFNDLADVLTRILEGDTNE